MEGIYRFCGYRYESLSRRI